MFTEAKERAKAFGIYGAIAGGGGAVGLILGGLLTEYLNWRWTLFVNVPFAVSRPSARADRASASRRAARNRNRLDIPGVLLVSRRPGLPGLRLHQAESDGWRPAITIGLFVAAAVRCWPRSSRSRRRSRPRCCRCAWWSTATAAASTSRWASR